MASDRLDLNMPTNSDSHEIREFLRSLPVFSGQLSEFDTSELPDDPVELFIRWLQDAVTHGVPEPHAMTLSTSDARNTPDARVLILKDIDTYGWWFASSSASAKGLQLAANPAAALTFYWPGLARQIRVRGPVVCGSAQLNANDFRARSIGARAVALASQESKHLADRATCTRAVDEAAQLLHEQPTLVSPSWQVYAVSALAVEFWQADKNRQHTRVQYHRNEVTEPWKRTLLWP